MYSCCFCFPLYFFNLVQHVRFSLHITCPFFYPFPLRRTFAYTTHLPAHPPEFVLPILHISMSLCSVSTPMSMSDLTPPTLLSLSLSSPLLCITHIFLSSCNMTRDSEDSEDYSINGGWCNPDRIWCAGTPEPFFSSFSLFLTFVDANTDL